MYNHKNICTHATIFRLNNKKIISILFILKKLIKNLTNIYFSYILILSSKDKGYKNFIIWWCRIFIIEQIDLYCFCIITPFIFLFLLASWSEKEIYIGFLFFPWIFYLFIVWFTFGLSCIYYIFWFWVC